MWVRKGHGAVSRRIAARQLADETERSAWVSKQEEKGDEKEG